MQKYILPLLAIAGLGFGVMAAVRSAQKLVPSPMVSEAPVPPYTAFVAGNGLVESNTENIAIGTHIAGIVAQVHVRVGDSVQKMAPLFTIDERAVRAALASQNAAVKVAEAQLERVSYEHQIGDALVRQRVISREDSTLRSHAKSIAAAQLLLAQKQAAALQVELERLTVRAPVDGQILQLKIHAGEFAQAGLAVPPLILMGNTNPLHVRVNVDENEVWRVRPGAPAVGFIRGNANMTVPLRYVRSEPYVIPKVALSGAAGERVDTRVLQVIYSFNTGDLPINSGQQLDVYIDASGVGPYRQ